MPVVRVKTNGKTVKYG